MGDFSMAWVGYWRHWIRLLPCLGVLSVGWFTACFKGPAMPAMDGAVVEVRRSGRSIPPEGEGFDRVLQIHWFGSGCHLIQLGDMRVVTDPYVTNGIGFHPVGPDPARVEVTFGRISPPDVVLVNHTHFDHFLDAHAAMTLPEWIKAGVPLHGGPTSRNLLAGWKDEELLARCHPVHRSGVIFNREVSGGCRLRVTAYESRHSPHFKCGVTLLDGKVETPRTSIPRALTDFPSGEVYNYLIEFITPGRSFTVFYLGAFQDLARFPDSMPAAGVHIDVAILTAPGHLNVDGYPKAHLARLRPRHIVLNHFNTFMAEKPDEQLAILGRDFVKLDALTREVQESFVCAAKDYPEFEALHIPAITRMESRNRGRNVILIR